MAEKKSKAKAKPKAEEQPEVVEQPAPVVEEKKLTTLDISHMVGKMRTGEASKAEVHQTIDKYLKQGGEDQKFARVTREIVKNWVR